GGDTFSYASKKNKKERRLKISKSNKGKSCSELTKQKISKANSGRKFTEDHKEKLSKARIGKKPWNKDKKGFYKHSEETKEKIGSYKNNSKKVLMLEIGRAHV